MPRPTAGAVIEAGRHHRGQDLRNIFFLDHLLAGVWVDAAIGERRPHPGKLPGSNADRALAGVNIHCFEWIGVDATVLSQCVTDGLIAFVACGFGTVDIFEDGELFTSRAAVEIEDPIELRRLIWASDQACGRNRPGVYEWVSGVRRKIHHRSERIEWAAGRLGSD